MSVTRIICPGGCGSPIAWCRCKEPPPRQLCPPIREPVKAPAPTKEQP